MAGKKDTRKSTKSSKATKKAPVTQSSKASLIFNVARVGRILRKGRYSDRVSTSGPVFLAAVIEYLAREILEISGEQAAQKKCSIIKPRHIQLAVSNDEELNKMMSTIQISDGGFKSFIHEALLPKKGKKGGKAEGGDTQEV